MNSFDMLTRNALVIEPKLPAESCVIWLHGLGSNGHNIAGILPEIQLPASHRIRFIFPHAPVRAVTLNQGLQMPAWYDIISVDKNSEQDEVGIRQAARAVQDLMDDQSAKGMPSHRISLIGFSQGGALALFAGLTYSQPLSNVIALSTYLPIAQKFVTEDRSANQSTPTLMAHGTLDTVVPFMFGEMSYQNLSRFGHNVTWKTYPIAHDICEEELKLIREWILKQS